MSFTNSKTKLFQLIMVILTSVTMTISLIFTYWLYSSLKERVDFEIKSDFEKTSQLVAELEGIKKTTLKNKAQFVSQQVNFKSALSTKHIPTIQDSLEEIVKSNLLDFVLVLKNKRIEYINSSLIGEKEKSVKELVRGKFIGATRLGEGLTVIVGQNIKESELEAWGKIASTNLSLTGEVIEGVQVSKDNKMYHSYIPILKGTAVLKAEKNRDVYWKSFNKKKNELVILTFVLLLLSVGISALIGKLILKIFQNEKIKMNETQFESLLGEIRNKKMQGDGIS